MCKSLLLVYRGGEEFVVKGFMDASFKSTIIVRVWFFFCLNRGVVNYKSSKQETVVNLMKVEDIVAQ